MKITDVTLTLFSWESIPSTIYGGPPLPPPPAIRRLRRTQPFAEFEARCLGRDQGPMVCKLFPGAGRIRTISTAQDPQHFCGVSPLQTCFLTRVNSEKRTEIFDGGARKSYGRRKPLEEWEVLLKGHHMRRDQIGKSDAAAA